VNRWLFRIINTWLNVTQYGMVEICRYFSGTCNVPPSSQQHKACPKKISKLRNDAKTEIYISAV